MDRRYFMKMVVAGASVLAMAGSLMAATSGTSDARIETRVKELLSKMTLDEKIEQMTAEPAYKILEHALGYGKYSTFNTPANKRLDIPGIRFIDGPRGANFKGSTGFPASPARGASWDVQLSERVGQAMGYEMRAQGANFTAAVCINIIRHPSWGRAQETFGEDPYHIGRMGVGFLTGLQDHVMACAKHFTANNIDESRMFVDIRMDERTLREVYLPHFKMCVEAGVASIMSAYNDVNGKLCAHNEHLLRDILKEDWGFKGFVISDFGTAVEDTVEAANAGLDIEMPVELFYGKRLKKAVLAGKVSEQVIDEAATRILRQKLRFYHLENRTDYDRNKVAGPEHTALAREVEQKGIVLLKNENSALPLISEKIKKIAVIGGLANKANLGDKGSSSIRPPYVITPLKGIKNKAGDSIKVAYESGLNPSRARRIAKGADAVIVVAGFTWKDEGEGNDRESLNLSREDEELIKAVAAESDRCIVVLESGSAITMESWKDKVEAILMAWYPGMEGGNAIADILFGDINPSGKLPLIFPKSADQLFEFDNKAKTVEYNRYHGYRYFDKNGLEPEFPFGFGLSYTEYKYGNLRLNRKKIGKSGNIKVKVDVTNVGKMAGEEIVQLYIGYNSPGVDRPVKDLKGFERIALDPGETGTVSIEVKAGDLAYYNAERGAWEVEEIEYIVYVGPSSSQEDLLSETFKVSGL